jgi:hypothetical protein
MQSAANCAMSKTHAMSEVFGRHRAGIAEIFERQGGAIG